MRKILFFLLFSSSLLFSQISNTDWELKKSTIEYSVNEEIVKVYSYEILNKSNGYLWLWFMKEDLLINGDKNEIKSYFFPEKMV